MLFGGLPKLVSVYGPSDFESTQFHEFLTSGAQILHGSTLSMPLLSVYVSRDDRTSIPCENRGFKSTI